MNALLKLLRSPQAGRWLRMVGFTIISAIATTPAAHTALLRFPLLGAILGVLEVAYRTAVPASGAAADPAPPAKG